MWRNTYFILYLVINMKRVAIRKLFDQTVLIVIERMVKDFSKYSW